jgi:hypothetical protein
MQIIITYHHHLSSSSSPTNSITGALQLFGELATYHPVVVQRNLPEMILKLIEMSSDVKKEVSG